MFRQVRKAKSCIHVVLLVGFFLVGVGTTPGADDPFLEVTGTSHNLAISSDQSPCLFCHTGKEQNKPSGDGVAMGTGQKPLWTQGGPAQPALFSSKIPVSPERVKDRPIGSSYDCLACHDGVVAMDVHKMGIREGGGADLNRLLGGFPEPVGGPGDTLFQFLDHPVSVSYPRHPDGHFVGKGSTPNQSRYWSIPDLTQQGVLLPSGPHSNYLTLPAGDDPSRSSLLVRTTGGMVQCDSCHNPHSSRISAFLRESGHTLCLICHNR